jgi:ABC-type Mn2+/Zn2+ transport system ATPase subunit
LGFLTPDSGTISISGDNQNPSDIRKITAWLPQDLNIGTGTVQEVITHPFRFAHNEVTPHNLPEIKQALQSLGLNSDILDQQFRDLSTGQRQRVGLAMCHLLDKPLLLLDEPTSALDKTSKERASKLLLAHTNKTIVSTAHDPLWVQKADNVIELT